MPVPSPTPQDLGLDDEDIQLISTINANRHKLSPEDLQSFESILQSIGPKNVPSTVAHTASARLNLAGQTSTPIRPYSSQPDTPGFWDSIGQTLNVPQNMEEVKRRLTPGMHWIPGVEEASGALPQLTEAGRRGGASGVAGEFVNMVDPTHLPVQQIGEGNYLGAAGSIAPQVLAAVAGSPAGPKIARAASTVKRGVAPAVRLTGAGLGGMLMDPWSPIRGAVRGITKSLKNRPPKPVVVPPSSITPVPEFPAGTDFPMEPTPARLPTTSGGGGESSGGSPPLRPVGDWNRPIAEAVYGDAPNQPLIRPRKVGKDFDPRSEKGKFAPVKSIPLKSDSAPTTPANTPATARLPVRTKLPKDVSATEVVTGARAALEKSRQAVDELKLAAAGKDKINAVRLFSKDLPPAPASTKPSSAAPRKVTWTDKTGTRYSGTVHTPIKSKAGPAFIVKDESGKSRFVLADKLKDQD